MTRAKLGKGESVVDLGEAPLDRHAHLRLLLGGATAPSTETSRSVNDDRKRGPAYVRYDHAPEFIAYAVGD